ncbi:heme NO-binding domain-containing protein [Pseudotabrizicola sp. L79]|uniref:heme NO-binding domain-containing protein n=1 Tax=Pseudotabrizicola sp. L79 TaxID=3118402 RepID=UPI002F92548A
MDFRQGLPLDKPQRDKTETRLIWKGLAMKGVVFVELLRMAEEAFGEDVVDDVLDKADLDNDGAFTAVGSYHCSDLVKIVTAFSDHSGLSPEILQKKFGHWMLEHFALHYPEVFKTKDSAFALLESVEREIHVEVRKLYPDAELPRFDTTRAAPNELNMTYDSPRPLAAFCHGMIEACLLHFNETGEIASAPHPSNDHATDFKITLTP